MIFGLFYQCLFKKTNNSSSEMYSGGTNSKVKLTGMAAASVTRQKLKMLVIGKSSSPRCFRHIKNLNLVEHYQHGSVISCVSKVFQRIIQKLLSSFID